MGTGTGDEGRYEGRYIMGVTGGGKTAALPHELPAAFARPSVGGKTIQDAIAETHDNNEKHGFLDPDVTFGEHIALLHSEAGEATDAWRKHGLDDLTRTRCHCFSSVGSELADVVIRLFDTVDQHGLTIPQDLELVDVAPLTQDLLKPRQPLVKFCDWIAWLHQAINFLWEHPDSSRAAVWVLRAVVAVAEAHDINWVHEYERKAAYNRTRPYRHGGRRI
jgi:NTP pyrophosphatase (non-canonical NTP hydrolase)